MNKIKDEENLRNEIISFLNKHNKQSLSELNDMTIIELSEYLFNYYNI